jgi:hypothetical protein
MTRVVVVCAKGTENSIAHVMADRVVERFDHNGGCWRMFRNDTLVAQVWQKDADVFDVGGPFNLMPIRIDDDPKEAA